MRVAVVTLAVVLAGPTWAQEDDDLAPLAPSAKPKAKPKPAVRPKPAPRAKPASPDDDLAPLAPASTTLNVRVGTSVAGAVLVLDGKEIGPLPLAEPVPVAPGEHSVLVRRLGFSSYAKKVTVAAGKAADIEARMNPVSAVLSFSSDVDGAQVLINGRIIGVTPISEREWPPGLVEIAIRREGFREEKQTVTLVAGRDYPVAVRLTAAPKVKPKPAPSAPVAAASDRPTVDQPGSAPVLTPKPVAEAPVAVTTSGETPLVQRWYFWVGVAAVAAAAVAVGVAVAQPGAKPRPLEFRDFCEGGVCPDACINVAMCSASFAGPGAAGIVNF